MNTLKRLVVSISGESLRCYDAQLAVEKCQGCSQISLCKKGNNRSNPTVELNNRYSYFVVSRKCHSG